MQFFGIFMELKNGFFCDDYQNLSIGENFAPRKMSRNSLAASAKRHLRPLRNSLRKVFGALTVVNATENQK